MPTPELEDTLKQGKATTRSFTFSRAMSCAISGIKIATKQRNYRIHLCFAAAAIVLGFALQISLASWLAVVLCIGIVLSLETINTAIECTVDLCTSEIHPLAKLAKDTAAGAVLTAAIMSIVVAFIVYVPPLLKLIGITWI